MKRTLLPLCLALVVAFQLPAAAQIVGAPGVSAVPTGSGAVGPALNFTLSPQQLQQNYQTATAKLDSALAAIAAVPPEAVTYANTVKAYEQATAAWQREMYPIGFLTAVSVDSEQRQAAADLEDKMETYGVSLGHREDLYKQFELAVAKGEKLSDIDARLLEDTVKSFRENGFALKSEEREKLKAMQERLGHLGNAFGRNIAESKDWLEVGPEGVKGLPADFVEGLERTADGRYKIDLNESSYVTYMRYAESAESRKSLLTKWQNRASAANIPVLTEALGLRRDIALLLGYKSYPEMTLKDRMAETPEKVIAFINRLKDVVLSRARADLSEILEIKRRTEPAATEVYAWETGYLSRILRQERYDLDSEKVKEYFPVDRVVEGTMKVYQKTLGLTFREMKDGPRWHPDVRLIEISDAADGRVIGHFYLDLYPRDGKYTHAAAFTVIKGRLLEDGTYEKPTSAMVANFPKAAPGKPALMPHAEVETFFHEFGHLMHQTLTKVPYASYSGSSVARDFVEAPSQMLENFVWERGVLDELSGHYKDGAKLPDDLYKKMLAARSFQDGLGYAGQLGLGMADMVLHTVVPEDVSAVFNKVMQEFTGLAPVEGTNRVASFGHLMGGYSAGYYGYLWSKVYAQDIYTVFKAAGVVSPEVGARYRREILEVGSSRPEMDSLRAFLGREPSEEAFMREVRGETAALDSQVLTLESIKHDTRPSVLVGQNELYDVTVKPGAGAAKTFTALDALFDHVAQDKTFVRRLWDPVKKEAVERKEVRPVTTAAFKLGSVIFNAGMDVRILKLMVRGLAPEGVAPKAAGVEVLVEAHLDPSNHMVFPQAGSFSSMFYMHETAGFVRAMLHHPLSPARMIPHRRDGFGDYEAQGRTLAAFTQALGERAAAGGDIFKGQRFLRAVRAMLRWVSRGRLG